MGWVNKTISKVIETWLHFQRLAFGPMLVLSASRPGVSGRGQRCRFMAQTVRGICDARSSGLPMQNGG